MTTILADVRWNVMVADTAASDGDRNWPDARKVWRIKGALLGFSGQYEQIHAFLDWFKRGSNPAEKIKFDCAYALLLIGGRLSVYEKSTIQQPVDSGRESIGSGAKAAMAAYDALWFTDPRKAVQIACKYDAGSRTPVRIYRGS